MGIFTQIGPLLIYFAGGWLIIAKGEAGLTVGAITAMVALVNRLYRPVESLLNIQVDFTRSLALFTRIFDYFDREIDIQSPKNAVKPAIKGADICYEHVRFGYTPDVEILHDINFTVKAADVTIITFCVEFCVHNIIINKFHYGQNSFKVVLHIRDFNI